MIIKNPNMQELLEILFKLKYKLFENNDNVRMV